MYVLVASVVSDSLRPHDLQPERLLCPWDSPGKNWSGLPFPSLGDLPDPGITPTSLTSPALAGRFFTIEPQVLKLQLITLSRDKCAGSDVVDITFFGPHTHTLSHTQAPNSPQSS